MEDIIVWDKRIFFMNIGEYPIKKPPIKEAWQERRSFEACKEFNFVSAGQGKVYSKQLMNAKIGDIAIAFITNRGYVGIFEVADEAVSIKDFTFKKEPFFNKTWKDFDLPNSLLDGKDDLNKPTLVGTSYLKKNLFKNANNDDAEFCLSVEWKKFVSNRESAYWKSNSGLFANPSIWNSLIHQTRTIAYIQEVFKVKFIFK